METAGSFALPLPPQHDCEETSASRAAERLGQGSLGVASGESWTPGTVLEGFYPYVQGMGCRVKRFPLLGAKADVPSEHCSVVLKCSWLAMPSFSLPAAFTLLLLWGEESALQTINTQNPPVNWGRIISSFLPVWKMTQKLIDFFKVTQRVSGRFENGTQES